MPEKKLADLSSAGPGHWRRASGHPHPATAGPGGGKTGRDGGLPGGYPRTVTQTQRLWQQGRQREQRGKLYRPGHLLCAGGYSGCCGCREGEVGCLRDTQAGQSAESKGLAGGSQGSRGPTGHLGHGALWPHGHLQCLPGCGGLHAGGACHFHEPDEPGIRLFYGDG